MAKTANVIARVEPEIKEQAEAILSQLGVPASMAINLLYRQIILNNGLPFSLTIPSRLPARDEMSVEEFNAMMQRGMDAAQENRSRPAKDVFSELMEGL